MQLTGQANGKIAYIDHFLHLAKPFLQTFSHFIRHEFTQRFFLFSQRFPDLPHHFATFWPVRAEPNLIMVHYSDLQRDLDGEMRRVAQRLGITIPDDRFSELVAAARFDAMRDRADEVAPASTLGLWQDNRQFFHAGRNGQWQTLLDDDGRRRYATRVAALAPDDVVAWAHDGPLDELLRD